jgi:antitoxin CptB
VDRATREKQLRFRSHNYGTRELDLLLGRFADAHLATLAEPDLDAYAALLECQLPDLFAWITGAERVPASHRSPILDRLIAFCRGEGQHKEPLD